MSDHVNSLAEAFFKYVPKGTVFYFATLERNGSVTTMSSIQDPGALVEFLEKCLERAERVEEGKKP